MNILATTTIGSTKIILVSEMLDGITQYSVCVESNRITYRKVGSELNSAIQSFNESVENTININVMCELV